MNKVVVILLAGFAAAPCAHALSQLQERPADRYEEALQRAANTDISVPPAVELSDKDISAFSGIGIIACTVDSGIQTATAFLVGAFDIGVTVAHAFEDARSGAAATDCFYTSIDSQGQVRERIAVSYVKSQWTEAGAANQPGKDVAVFRLSQPSRYAQKTMPLGRFSGDTAPVIMVGYRADIGWSTSKRKASGIAFERSSEGLSVARFTHDMDSRGIAPGAPVIDERTGVIIGIHTRLSERNGIITMSDWLESTLRNEIQQKAAKNDAEPGDSG
jgi:trypsin-like peptidase